MHNLAVTHLAALASSHRQPSLAIGSHVPNIVVLQSADAPRTPLFSGSSTRGLLHIRTLARACPPREGEVALEAVRVPGMHRSSGALL